MGYCTVFVLLAVATKSHVVVQSQQLIPIIGGKCDINARDVPIGGKQTQFFLKCEQSLQSESGKGVWVVKSRSASTVANMVATSPSVASSTTPPATFATSENTISQEHPQQFHKLDSNICVQDKSAKEDDPCAVSSICLQQDQQHSPHYLQCDQSSGLWLKKSCLPGQIFSFEHQACIVASGNPLKLNRLPIHQNIPSSVHGSDAGIVCTFMQCSQNNPCQQGTCNNGYCCMGHGVLRHPFAAPPLQHYQQPLSINQLPFVISNQMQAAYNPFITNVCANGGTPAGTCINMRCARGYVCSPGNICCPPSITTSTANPMKNPFVCTDGTQAAGACIGGQCGAPFTCVNGLCCNKTSSTPRCLDGSLAVGACIQGQCGAGFVCTTGNLCCSSTSTNARICPNGGTSIGDCINGLCPTGYTCINTQCCPGASNTTFRCSNFNYVLGPCIGDQCPDAGFECDTTINSCCPKTDPVGPCIEPGDQCPDGYKCFTEGTTPVCYKICDGRGTKSGVPANGVCPGGPNTLIFGDCCTLTTRFYNAQPMSFLSERHVDYPLPFIRSAGIGTCPDGSAAVSACINGLCGLDYQCYNNLCCPAQSVNMMLPFSITTLRPIGSPCEFSQQCVSFMEGLSICKLGICRCLPNAYVNGFICVRHLNMVLNDMEQLPSNGTLSNDFNALVTGKYIP